MSVDLAPAASSGSLLDIERVFVNYGALQVLKGVSLSVLPMQTLAVIGPNGAGKTTLFKAMSGETACAAGSIRFAGDDVTTTPAYLRARRGMGRTFQVSRIFPDFSALDNVIVALEQRDSPERSTAPWWRWRPAAALVDEGAALLATLGLTEAARRPAAALAHGDKKRLEFALTLALKPSLLLLDEPTAGMSPGDRMKIVETIKQISDERGVAVILTEHDMDVIYNLADKVLVLNYGEVIATGTVEEVRKDETVRRIYLGKERRHAAG